MSANGQTAELEPTRQTPKVRVGDIVYFYAGGSTSDPPLPGFVVEVFGSMLTVRIPIVGSGIWHDKSRVHHKDAEILKTNPQLALRMGMWDFRDPPELHEAMLDLISPAKPKEVAKTKKTEPEKTTSAAT